MKKIAGFGTGAVGAFSSINYLSQALGYDGFPHKYK